MNTEVEELINALNDSDQKNRWEAELALSKIGQDAVRPLLCALKNESYLIRQGVIHALSKVGDESCIEPLIEALNDNHVSVRQAAAGVLGKFGDARAVGPLLELLFEQPGYFGEDSFTGSPGTHAAKSLRQLAPSFPVLKKWVEVFIDAAGYDYPDYSNGIVSMRRSDAAVKRICSVRNPLTDNLLVLISQKKDAKVDVGGVFRQVDFNEQRGTALQELNRRGSPKYDQSIFKSTYLLY